MTDSDDQTEDDAGLAPFGPRTLAGKIAAWGGVTLLALFFAVRAVEPAYLLVRDGLPAEWSLATAAAFGLGVLTVVAVVGTAGYIVVDYWRRRSRHEEMNEILDEYNREVAGSETDDDRRGDEVVVEFDDRDSGEEARAGARESAPATADASDER